jgi:signal transduction histidine kinase
MRSVADHAVYAAFGALLAWPYLLVLTVVLPLSLALIVVWVGIPTTIVLLGLVRSMAAAERRLANGLLGTSITAPARIAELAGSPWAQFRLLLAHGATWRGLLFLVLRTVIGLVLSIAALIGVVTGVVFAAAPFIDAAITVGAWESSAGWQLVWAPVVGFAFLAVTVLITAGCGWVTARLAEQLLGPSPNDEMRRLEVRAAALGAQNRLARELHDSVGHTMTTVVVQASAARRLFDADPEFARGALVEIESAARTALEELDGVLGEMRGDAPTAPSPRLTALPRLLGTMAANGLPVAPTVHGDLAAIPAVVSTEAYRIVQEALTNVVRHAGPAPTALTIDARSDLLTIIVSNAAPTDVTSPAGSPSVGQGGRGLVGVAERVTMLGGQFEAGTVNGGWLLRASLPCPR